LNAEALKAGTGAPGLLFPRLDGRPFDKSALYHSFKVSEKRAGLFGHRPYDCRHAFATLALSEENAPLTWVSAMLGHANPATTLRHYSRWLPSGDGQRWAVGLDRQDDDVVETRSGDETSPEEETATR
jgi:integrase